VKTNPEVSLSSIYQVFFLFTPVNLGSKSLPESLGFETSKTPFIDGKLSLSLCKILLYSQREGEESPVYFLEVELDSNYWINPPAYLPSPSSFEEGRLAGLKGYVLLGLSSLGDFFWFGWK